MTGNKSILPRDTTRQSEMPLYGELARTLNRWSGLIILFYLVLHLLGQAGLTWSRTPSGFGYLAFFQYVPWVRSVLFSAITFHFVYGLNLIALDLGTRIDYRISFLTISAFAIFTGIWEARHYIGF